MTPRPTTFRRSTAVLSPLRSLVATTLLVGLASCGGPSMRPWTPATDRDTKDDPAAVRPMHGNPSLRTWWPASEADRAALQGVDKAKSGDAQALLALAIAASGDSRDDAAQRAIRERVEKFVTEVSPAVKGAADDWHRGYELHRAMHRVFLGGTDKAAKGELGKYRLQQSRVSVIFDSSEYNCISSAMLFVVLARSFNLPVRGVLVPTHAFVEMGARGGKIFEIETTSNTGFDLVHDERFYREGAATWSSQRGLRPVTMDDYRKREVVEPYRFMARGMLNQAIQPGTSDADRGRLIEMAAVVDPDSADVQRERLASYVDDANKLFEQKASRTIAKMFDAVGADLAQIAQRHGGDAETMRTLRWLQWYFADSLQIVGRGADALLLVDEAIPRVDPAWKDGSRLRDNFFNVLSDHMLTLESKKDYEGAAASVSKHVELCRASSVCAHNLEVVYGNWSIEHHNAGNWPAARKALQECVARLPDSSRCRDALRDLESRHRF